MGSTSAFVTTFIQLFELREVALFLLQTSTRIRSLPHLSVETFHFICEAVKSKG